ncbi:outer membrane beta-barrel family protein [Adhaeribacter radiodurans]|uniref:TonB-dependent receptor n=1 Tax=Adhaeribacter radiodurans TaxID=2745197 RepID=A0A7L7L2M2_9BACT|nr:outer membrane beta-barrel family protein [Adhaeribacter radiodurans]QMU26845.1 TonB-dependent receptor [Adhaeribacter radiodurans]
MKNIFRLLLFTIGIIIVGQPPVIAQNNNFLTGTLKDAKGTIVGYATVAVVQAASKTIVNGGISEANGNFKIKAPATGQYLLRVSAIGYTQTETPFELTNSTPSKDFGTLTLKEDTQVLKEVNVQALRPTITNHPDKMVVSIEGTALSTGNTAYDVLLKSPGVFVDQDGNIQLNGKSGVRIMIDGKLTYLSGKELQTMLQGMAAENLKDLELITNPSAKYDAEGTAGIININLKKNTLSGINGSIYGGYQYNNWNAYSMGGNLNVKKGKWNSFVNADFARRIFIRDARLYREFNSPESSTQFKQTAKEKGIRQAPSFRLGTDYDINQKHSIGVMANIYYQDMNTNFRSDLSEFHPQVQDNKRVFTNNRVQGKFANGTVNAHYLGKLDTLGTTLAADLDFVRIYDHDEATYANQFSYLNKVRPDSLVDLANDNPSSFNIYSAKVDYTKPFTKKTKLEAGAKASHVVSDNDLRFFQVADEQLIKDFTRSNHFIYRENIYAAYANFSTSLGEKWKIQGGLRAEKTISEGKSITKDSVNSRNYLNWFPSIFLMQQVNKDYKVTYNYSRRINRPYYGNLNPFVFYIDPYTSAQGNPYLRPQYTHSFQVTQSLKDTYSLSIGYADTQDFMAEVPVQNNANNTMVFQQRNGDQFKDINAALVAPIKITPKWDMNNNLTVGYQSYTIAISDQAIRNEQFFVYGQSSNNIQLPRDWRLEVNLDYRGPRVYAAYQIKQSWAVDAGLKRSFLNKKLEVSANVTDIFRTRRFAGTSNVNGNVNEINQYFAQRSLRLNLRYNFNKGEKFEAKKRNTNLEELNRAGGN